ncbi:MFS transporter [Streptomyces sp. NPDC088354]|uniref:MFS transporter n=1 Tax=Streptomyces sp. NPDC088354 TaxID=3365856 RepID=UPI0037FB243B
MTPPVPGRDRRRPGRSAGFTVLAVTTVVMTASASAPSPMYPLYRERWGFSLTMVTVVFAVYVVGLLGALLTLGSLGDRLGRRPVLVAALLLAAVGTAVLWTANGVPSLVVARVVQGVATGTATSGLAAGLVEFSPARRPHAGTTVTAVGTNAGLAAGAAVAGLLAQFVPRPDRYAFSVLTVVLLVLAVLVLRIPETAVPRAGSLRASLRGSLRASLRPRVRVPQGARHRFLAAVPALVAGWAVTGLFLALTPSLVSGVLHVTWGAAGGLDIALLFLAGAVGGMWSVRRTTRSATLLGAAFLALGAAGLAAAVASASPVAFWCGTVPAGLGAGLTFNGHLGAIAETTTADSRSQAFSAVYVVSYLALSLPSLAAGFLMPSWGLRTTSFVSIGCVGALSLTALVHAGRRRPPTGIDTRTPLSNRTGEPPCKPSPSRTATPASADSP